ncbi:type II toxin-antitoxin system RelE/ParE family toxin [Rhizobium deserti]|uniref:Type II toxin-antitoxin system RelE/ParE family toxin n=1 Tax=Rhizobium deserti TaxID=2547961 RepID=A0A4R5UIS7_9HYPH|nr:type II toxin-antitoxin system RelE/ParE family toxin [Rhizobium deserti]TDK36738.1 type II toxin-antitoxin system RelE/ParE family toxin [Rhizobium deserti]
MLPIRYTKRALGRLRHVGDWIGQDNPAAAERVVARIARSIDLLRDHPHKGRPGRLADTREFVLTDIPYIIVYRLMPNHIQIITIMHTSQRWPDRL